ncbi:MAG: insulinase family protein [Treponema sp.]|nr:insulinase family protein [Treponema sp.]
MKLLKNLLAATVALVLTSAVSVFAEKTPIDDLYQYKLDNGLSLFVAENHSVPLVYIEIAVKAGATTQTPETAGLFHLYEHMMFKGNELYTSSAAVQRAVKDMGVSKWNAYTEIDCVHYYFTLPSDQLENGMAFWNAAIRAPLMNEQELENEKKVVLSEIEGDSKTSSDWISQYMNFTMFPEVPYRFDTAGSLNVVKNATVAQMRDMQSKYYIPANSALFIGGDVMPEEVYDMTKKIFGTWSNNGNKVPELPPQPSKSPLETRQKSAFVLNSDYFRGEVDYVFRGPDLGFDEKDSYIASYLAVLLNEGQEDFKQSLIKQKHYQFYDVDDITVSYKARRAGSLFFINLIPGANSNYLTITTECPPAVAQDVLYKEIVNNLIPSVVSKKYAFSPEKKELIINRMKASDLKKTQSSEGLLSLIRSYWASASVDYYYNYYDNIRNVTREDAIEWVKKYITNESPLTLCIETSRRFDGARRMGAAGDVKTWLSGYDIIEKKNKDSIWYKNKKFAPDPDKIAKETAVPKKSKIYVPTGDFAASKKYMVWEPPKIDTRYLKNKIPVHFLNDKDKKVNFIHIGVRGGPTYIDSVEFSGLEKVMFESMTLWSRVYNQESRKRILAESRSSIYASTFREGSVYSLGTTDMFLTKTLPIYLDGFMHPSFKTAMPTATVNCAKEDVWPAKSEPISFLNSKIYEQFTKGHPYEKSNTMTDVSANFVSGKGEKKWEDAISTLYNDIIRPENIFVVVTGNVDADMLMDEFEKTLGTITETTSKTSKDKKANKKKNRDNEALQAELAGVVPPYTISGEDEVFTLASIPAGTGYAMQVVSAPSVESDDYLPSLIAADMYNDLLFNVVREHYGVCYTPSAYISGGKASLGMVELYKISDFEHFASRVKEACGYMEQGKLIDSTDKSGKFEFSTVDKRLQSYKNAQIIATYSPQATVQGMGASMVYNLLTYNEPFRTRKMVSQIHDATASQVLDVFKKYWVNAPGKWFVVVNEEDEDSVTFE